MQEPEPSLRERDRLFLRLELMAADYDAAVGAAIDAAVDAGLHYSVVPAEQLKRARAVALREFAKHMGWDQ